MKEKNKKDDNDYVMAIFGIYFVIITLIFFLSFIPRQSCAPLYEAFTIILAIIAIIGFIVITIAISTNNKGKIIAGLLECIMGLIGIFIIYLS